MSWVQTEKVNSIVYTGEDLEIKRNRNCTWRFNYGEVKEYSLEQLQKMYKKVHLFQTDRNIENDYGDSDSDFEEISMVDRDKGSDEL